MARGAGTVTKKVLSLRELQMAKRMLNQPKVRGCLGRSTRDWPTHKQTHEEARALSHTHPADQLL